MERYWELTKKFPNKVNQEVISDFLLHLKLSNRSEGTILLYKRFLERFFGDKEEPYNSLTSNQILKWLQENKGNIKESTYRIRLNTLSSFYNFCVRESLVVRSPIKRRWFPRLSKPIPKYLEKADIARVRLKSEQSTVRNQAIVELLLSSGCRVGELHQLNIKDVDLENRTARVMGKGKKIRQVHFSEKCAVLLERYLESHEKKETSPLFVKLKGAKTRISIDGIRKVLYSLGEKAGLLSSLHPHRLRHTFATELLGKGAELSFISDELGHADLETTQIYARLPNQAIISQYRKYMG